MLSKMKFLVKLQLMHFFKVGFTLVIIVQPNIVVQIEVIYQPTLQEHNKLEST